MKTKSIEITTKNIGFIYGRLKKFFNNPNYGFTMHHNFDCGYNKIKPYMDCEKEKCDKPDKIEIDREIYINNPFIRVIYQQDVSAEVIEIGDRIIFNGNRIIIRKEWYKSFKDHNYIYCVYELCKFKTDDIDKINKIRYIRESLADMDNYLD